MGQRWQPPTDPNPFQALMLDYMWQHRPPMNMPKLADHLQLPYTTIHGWFEGRLPHASVLRHVALMTGIPLTELLRAAGYERVPEAAQQPLRPPPYLSPMFDAMERQVYALPGITGNARHALLEMIKKFRVGDLDQFSAERHAEHRIVEVEPVKQAEIDTATDAQQERPKQTTRTKSRRRRDSAHKAPVRA